MGYYIEANMNFTGATAEEVDLITSYIEENEDDFYLIYPNGESKTEGKWYDRDVHFKTLSLKFPNVLFNLYCCGEDGAKWLEYYKNGVYKRVEAIITYDNWED